jgi:hypothetical protein
MVLLDKEILIYYCLVSVTVPLAAFESSSNVPVKLPFTNVPNPFICLYSSLVAFVRIMNIAVPSAREKNLLLVIAVAPGMLETNELMVPVEPTLNDIE